jgi:hypothetical protein
MERTLRRRRRASAWSRAFHAGALCDRGIWTKPLAFAADAGELIFNLWVIYRFSMSARVRVRAQPSGEERQAKDRMSFYLRMFAGCFGSDWALGITFPESWPRHGISCCGFLNHVGAEPSNSRLRFRLISVRAKQVLPRSAEQYTCPPLEMSHSLWTVER